MSLTPDTTYLQQILTDMVKIDSRNPSLTPNAPAELELGRYVAAELTRLGLEVDVQTLAETRVNVIGTLKGSGGGKSLLLNGHLDTVGVEGMSEPYSARVSNGKLYGRGAQDMKGSLAAMLAAVKTLKDSDVSLKGDVLLTFVADEEARSIGMEHLVKTYRADAAIITEPTDMQLCLAHRGFIWFEVETFGRAAHGSRYAEGVDANMHMALFLAEVHKLNQDLLQRTPHPLAGPPSLHVAQVNGGTENSTYAAHCKAVIERRTIPNESVAQCSQELQTILDVLSKSIPDFQAKLTVNFERSPFEISPTAPIIQSLEAAMSKQLNAKTKHTGGLFWTDAALLADAGINTVLIGPVGAGLHSAEEWVDLNSLTDLAHVLTDVMLEFCA